MTATECPLSQDRNPLPAPARRSSRGLILEAARGCFLRYGYGKTTIADIAAGAGLTRRTVYQHYADKGAIWQTIVADAAGCIADGLCDQARGAAPIAQRLHAVLRAAPALFEAHALGAHERPRVALSGGSDGIHIDGFHGAVWGPVASLLIGQGALAPDIGHDDLVAWLTLTGSAMAVASACDSMDEIGTMRDMAIVPLLPADRRIDPVTDILAYRAIAVRLESLRADRSTGPTIRDRIVEAALRRFSQERGRDMTIADIAADAQVDRRTVYRHFADRKALVEEVALLEARRVNSQIRRLLVRRPDPADIVTDGILLSIRIFDGSPLKEQLVAGTEFLSSASDRGQKIFPFVRQQWQQILQRMTELRNTNPRIGVDAMARWILLMQHVFHRSLDLPASDDAGIRRFVRRFPVDALVTDADSSMQEGPRT